MNVPPHKIVVLYPGIGPHFRRVEDAERLRAVRSKYQMPERFLLHVGTIEPRKNLERLIAAYKQVRDERSGASAEQGAFGLILAGKPGWLADGILRLAGETAGVQLAGPVADEDLPALYTIASGLVYPSLYEGFGFPPLEALACGTPAVASNTSSLPELLGDAALLVDPHDTAALCHALRRLLDEPDLARTARTAGPRQAAHFSWPRAAQQLLHVYYSLRDEASLHIAPAPGGD